MRVIVAGASGTLGGPLLRILTEHGHDVLGLTRTPAGAELVRSRGAQPVIADALDRDGLLRALDGVAADAVLHELTALKKAPARFADMDGTNRLRTLGSTHLVEAAVETGATRFLTQSIVFGYGYAAVGHVDETSPFGVPAGDRTDDAVLAMASAEEQAFAAPGIDGIALRYGLFYGADVRTMAHMLDRRMLPVPARWRGTIPMIHHEDAATATVAALERGVAGRAYNIVDDTALSWRDFIETVASSCRTRSPLVIPDALARIVAPYAGLMMTRIDMQADNTLARNDLGWSPRYASVADGLREASVG